MAVEKKLYRSRDALIGGVCAGIAEYFDIDPIIVRIAAVVLTVVSAGACAIAYVALWAILPKAPAAPSPLDVSPEEVRSDIYERVVVHCDPASGECGQAGYPVYGPGVGHIPPQPPSTEAAFNNSYYRTTGQVPFPSPQMSSNAAAWAYREYPPVAEAPSSGATAQPAVMPFAAQQTERITSEASPGTSGAPVPSSAPAIPTPPTVPVASPSPSSPSPGKSPTERGSVKAALFIGFTLLFLGVAALLGNMIEGVYWWQFWPLIFVITGIGQMVIPGKPGRRMKHFVEGMMTCMFGLFALPISLDIVSFVSLRPIFENLWPILLIMAGFFILGEGLKSPIFTLFAGFCFVGFCVVGLLWFSIPGSTEWIGITLPSGAYYSVAVGSIL